MQLLFDFTKYILLVGCMIKSCALVQVEGRPRRVWRHYQQPCQVGCSRRCSLIVASSSTRRPCCVTLSRPCPRAGGSSSDTRSHWPASSSHSSVWCSTPGGAGVSDSSTLPWRPTARQQPASPPVYASSSRHQQLDRVLLRTVFGDIVWYNEEKIYLCFIGFRNSLVVCSMCRSGLLWWRWWIVLYEFVFFCVVNSRCLLGMRSSFNWVNVYTKLVNVYCKHLLAIWRPITKRRWFSVTITALQKGTATSRLWRKL